MRAWIIGGVLAATWCGPGFAWTGEVSWPTFYRAGPGREFIVLDEVDRGAKVDVLACGGGWCQVRRQDAIGYIEETAVVQQVAVPVKPPVPGPQDCVESRVTGSGYQKGLYYEFCPRPGS